MPINYKLYPSNWKSHFVKLVRIRSGGKCEQCGLSNGQIVYSVKVFKIRKNKVVTRSEWYANENDVRDLQHKKVKVILTVAHLDHDSHNHLVKIDRLKDLCQLCHLQMDAPIKSMRKKLVRNQLSLGYEKISHGSPNQNENSTERIT